MCIASFTVDPLTDAPGIAAGLRDTAAICSAEQTALAARMLIAAFVIDELRARCMAPREGLSSAVRSIAALGPPPFLLELRSERMIDALLALSEAGFSVSMLRGAANRYVIEDASPESDARSG